MFDPLIPSKRPGREPALYHLLMGDKGSLAGVSVTGLTSLDPSTVETRLDPKFKSTSKAFLGLMLEHSGGAGEREEFLG